MSSARSSRTPTAWSWCVAASSSTDRPPSSRQPGTTHPMHILDLEFMRLALVAGVVVGLLAPAGGFFLVQRQLSLIGDGVGHIAFAGVAAGYLIGVSPTLSALVAAVAGAVGIEELRSRRTTAGDQALALFFYGGIAAGGVVLSGPHPAEGQPFSNPFCPVPPPRPRGAVWSPA